MFAKTSIRYILNNLNFFFLYSIFFFKNDILLFCKSATVRYISIFIKYSYLFKNSTLLDLFAFEVPFLRIKNNFFFKHIIVYLYLIDNIKLYIFSFIKELSIYSIEILFRNAKWLEREVSDFFNIFFKYKKDRRSLFTIPLLFNHVLEKKFPTTGFYELFICTFLKKLKFKHISNLV